ncbi:AI-2E family transporter [Rhodobacteraceae bacterium 2CG4]|uniref:AI-2E family transporter n=1 Tax=Halovulum marinum TaxID=2662447 RepID=A0A6L5Z1A4_9RHOB|nr:AI-2E family transporter [Halovulum marinum]MSU89840.1 AI-2E family transporter [Halovulum marinum]
MTISDTLYRGAVVFLAAVAMFVVLSLAEAVFAPLLLALVIGVVLSPLLRLGERLHLPRVLNALFALIFGLGVLALLIVLLEPPVSSIAERAPAIWYEVRGTFTEIQTRLNGLMQFSDEVSETLGEQAENREGGNIPTWTDALLLAPSLAAQILIFVGGLFFFLLTRAEVYDGIARLLPRLERAQIERVEHTVSHYFLTISVINFCFGASVALALHLLGMPSPILWGVIAAAMNYILYLGPALVALSLAVSGIVVYDGAAILLPPLVFVALNVAEGQFITPALVGRHMSVNPLLVFFSLVFWLWLWGPVGGFIAIPLLLMANGLWEQARPPAATVAPVHTAREAGPRREAGPAAE